jgi:hypothetical protein
MLQTNLFEISNPHRLSYDRQDNFPRRNVFSLFLFVPSSRLRVSPSDPAYNRPNQKLYATVGKTSYTSSKNIHSHVLRKLCIPWSKKFLKRKNHTRRLSTTIFMVCHALSRQLYESRLRYYTTSMKLVGSIPDVTGFFNWSNTPSRTMVLGSIQSLTEMSTRNLSGCKGRPARKADNLKPSVSRLSTKCGSLDVSRLHGLLQG